MHGSRSKIKTSHGFYSFTAVISCRSFCYSACLNIIDDFKINCLAPINYKLVLYDCEMWFVFFLSLPHKQQSRVPARQGRDN